MLVLPLPTLRSCFLQAFSPSNISLLQSALHCGMAEWVRHKTSTVFSLTAIISESQCGRVESPSFLTDFYTGTAKISCSLLCWRCGFSIGGRTAWSCHVIVHGTTFAARYWFDGDFVQNAMEDAAEVALKVLDSKSYQQPSHGPPSGTVPWALYVGRLRLSSSFLSTPPFEGTLFSAFACFWFPTWQFDIACDALRIDADLADMYNITGCRHYC